jgi:uncharacterized protein (TIGR03437 family)
VLVTADGSGRGQAAALNENGSVNSAGNRSRRGGVLVVWATGGGIFDTPVPSGTIFNGASRPRLRLPVAAFVNGVTADILYAGQAPNMPAGALQFNIRIPDLIDPGAALSLTLRFGDSYFSQPGVTIAVE